MGITRRVGWEEFRRNIDRDYIAIGILTQTTYYSFEIWDCIRTTDATVYHGLIVRIEHQSFDEDIQFALRTEFTFSELDDPGQAPPGTPRIAFVPPVKGLGTPSIVLNSRTLDSSALAVDTDPEAKNALKTSIATIVPIKNFFIFSPWVGIFCRPWPSLFITLNSLELDLQTKLI